MNAHPTALIDSRAQIDDDVEIGPYSIVEGGARIESGCRVASHAHLLGSVRLGPNCRVGAGAIIGADPQSIAFDPSIASGVELGGGNIVREYVTIHRGLHEGQNTRVGVENFLMTGAHIGHDCVVGDHNVIANNCLLGGHVTIGNRCFLGGCSVFHQFTRIGDHVMTQGLAGLGFDVPPFLIAAGVNRIAGINLVGLKRAGFDRAARAAIREAFTLIYRGNLNLTQALEAADERDWDESAARFIDFFRQESHRGFCLRESRGNRKSD